MASAVTDSSDWLLSCPWAAVDIGDSRFLCKSWFGQTQYHVLLMDSDCLWEEHLQEAELQSRAQELNRRLRASTESFFSHLVAVVKPCLTGEGRGRADQVTVQRCEGHMTLRLKSELAGLPLYWEFHCRPAPVVTACVQLVRPLLAMSGALQRQTQLLFKLLWKKDAEIQDYRENGAQLSRERLQTEAFDEDSFRRDFMTTIFPSLLDEQSHVVLDSELQELFSTITSQQQKQQQQLNKRKHPDQATPPEEATPTPDATPTNEDTPTKNKEGDSAENMDDTQAKNTTLPTMQQRASYPCAADRAAPKPKKKKTGLFR